MERRRLAGLRSTRRPSDRPRSLFQGSCSDVGAGTGRVLALPLLTSYICTPFLVTSSPPRLGLLRPVRARVRSMDALTDDVLAVLKKAARSEAPRSWRRTIDDRGVTLSGHVSRARSIRYVLIDPQITYLPTEEMPWMPSPAHWPSRSRPSRHLGHARLVGRPRQQGRQIVARYTRRSVTPGGLAAELTRCCTGRSRPSAPHDPGSDARARRQRSFLRGLCRHRALRSPQDPGRPRRRAFEARRATRPLVRTGRRDRG